jgi:DNA-directed RNA polymerase
MLPVVEKFAADCMGHTGWKCKNDERTVEGDLADARWLSDRAFWLDYRCDSRGRMYAVQRFSYDREDHVRSLIEFDQAVYCGKVGIQWLEFNAANLYGEVDKEKWGLRSRWTMLRKDEIRQTVKDPASTFDWWRKADKPLQFVRTCFELVQAWDSPDFETCLPVGIDATASGLQHLALLGRDRDTMGKVNLTLAHDGALDIYGAFAEYIEGLLRQDSDHWSRWWLDRLQELGGKKRKLFKGPVGTFSYASTGPSWNRQIREAYEDLERQGFLSEALPRDDDDQLIKRGGRSALGYLTDKIEMACPVILPGPTAIMRWLQDRAELQASRNQFVLWDSASSFPCCNREEPPNVRTLYLPDGQEIEIADGTLPGIDIEGAQKSITANFVHSMDAAHAALTINAAVKRGITSIITCHDCFYGHAPRMYDLQRVVLTGLSNMYQEHDPLHELWLRNGGDGDRSPRRMDDKEYYERLHYLPCCDYAFS